MTFMMIIQLLVVLIALWVGARYGSLALGAISGIGLAVLVFAFHLKPGTPPTEVIYIIIAAVTCAGVLQASGGMDWMIQIAEKLLRKHPDRITLMAPFVTFFLTVLVGTGHVIYTLMPIICDIALKKGIRPERPCSIASISSQIGITCSPIAAAVVAFSAISAENGFEVTNVQIVLLTLPACIIGILMAIIYSYRRGLDLDKDPEFQKKIQDPNQRAYIYGGGATTLGKEIPQHSKNAVYIFMTALGVILVISLLKMAGIDILPGYDTVRVVEKGASIPITEGVKATAKQLASLGIVIPGITARDVKVLSMSVVIQIIMIVAAALMIIFCKAKPKAAMQGVVWQNGMVAVVAHLRHCLDEQYLFRQLSGPDAEHPVRGGDKIPVDHRPGLLLRLCAHQFPGRGGGEHAAPGLHPGHRGLDSSGGDAVGVRLLLHPQLSFGHRDRKL